MVSVFIHAPAGFDKGAKRMGSLVSWVQESGAVSGPAFLTGEVSSLVLELLATEAGKAGKPQAYQQQGGRLRNRGWRRAS